MDWDLTPGEYFAVRQVTDRWTMGEDTFDVTFWRRPLTAMTAAMADAGFLIERLLEPQPSLELKQVDAKAYGKLTTAPRFLFFRLVPSPES